MRGTFFDRGGVGGTRAAAAAFAVAGALTWSGTAGGQCTTEVLTRLGGETGHVAVIDANRVVISNGTGLEIVNVTNPGSMVRTGRLELGERVWKIRVVSGVAYVGVVTSGDQRWIRRYTLATTVPSPRDLFWTGERTDFDTSGSEVYVASHQPGQTTATVTAINVAFPDSPLLDGVVSIPTASFTGPEMFFSVVGSRGFLSAYSGSPVGWRLWAFGVADPEAMTVLGSYTSGSLFGYESLAGSGTYIYASKFEGTDVLNMPVGQGITRVATLPAAASDMVVGGTTLYMASEEGGVRAYNIASPGAPAALPTLDTGGSSHDLALSGTRCYGAEREGGLVAVNITNPGAISLLGSIVGPVPSRIEDITESGGSLYVLDKYGLRVLSTANPGVLIGQSYLADYGVTSCGPRVVRVYNGNAYITGCDLRLRVLSLANPAAPFLRAEVPGLDMDYDAAFLGNYGYFCGGSGLRIMNIANPSAPTLAATFAAAGVVSSVEIRGSLAYVGTRDFGLWILSLANPTSPQLVGFYDTPGRGACFGVAVDGTTAYIGRSTGLEIYDVSDPSAPRLMSFTPGINPRVHDPVKFSGGKVFVEGVADDSGPGLHVVDVGSATAPVRIGGVLGQDVWGFMPVGNRIFYGDREASDLKIATVQTQWAPAFRRHPADTVPCLGQYGLFNVAVTANPAAVTYSWLKDGVALTADGRHVGVDGPNLTVLNLQPQDAGVYTCVATNSCGSTQSRGGRLSFCPVDFNCDGFVDFFDYDDYIACFVGGPCPPGRDADFNFDGFADFFDYDDFVAAFEAGC